MPLSRIQRLRNFSDFDQLANFDLSIEFPRGRTLIISNTKPTPTYLLFLNKKGVIICK